MDYQAHKQLAQDYLETIINQGRLDVFDQYFADDVIFNGSSNFKQHLGRMFGQMHQAFPDLRVTVEDQIAEEDRVVSRVAFKGTHQGEFNGIAASGKAIHYSGIAIDRVRDGKIVEMWHLADMAGLMRQLSAPPRRDQ